MELSDYRQQIDGIDSQLLALFYRRMDVAAQIGGYKKAHNLPALDAGRERAKLQQIADAAPEDLREYAVSLYSLIFELSRSCQNRLLGVTSPLTAEIEQAIARTPQLFPEHPAVACQGVEGAYSQLACDQPVHDCRTCFTAPRLRRCSPPSKRACAATVSSRWKTARPAPSTPCTI
ncbi:MAG: chorismate mutase [Oscillospiraceae bacterium]